MSATIPTGTKIIALGPELIDQDLWADEGLAWWGVKDSGWSGDGIKIISDGTNAGAYLYRVGVLIPGKIYRWEFSIYRSAGVLNLYCGAWPEFLCLYFNVDRVVYYPTANDSTTLFYAMSFVGEITYLSVREVLS